MKSRAYILYLLTNLMVLSSYAQNLIDSTNIDSLLNARKEAYYPKTFTLEDTVFEVGNILLKDIWFHYNYSGLHEDSFPFLDSVDIFLERNNGIILGIKYFTDFRGSDRYNKALSERRAECIKDYFIKKGISESRLTSIGKGESELIISKEETESFSNRDSQEKAHALNIRTEFKIIAIN